MPKQLEPGCHPPVGSRVWHSPHWVTWVGRVIWHQITINLVSNGRVVFITWGAVGAEACIRASVPVTQVRFQGGCLGRRFSSPHMVHLAVPWNRVRVPVPWCWLDIVHNPQPTNHFHNMSVRVWLFPSPQNSGTTSSIYEIQTVFSRSGKFLQRSLVLLSCGSPTKSQVMSKSKCLKTWHTWFYCALQPYRMEISQLMAWIVSGTLLRITMSLWWTHLRSSSSRVRSSRTGQTKHFMFGWCDECL